MKANIHNLKEQTAEFAKNMAELGNLLKDMKVKYSAFDERITQLEKEMNSVIISLDRLEDLHI